MLIKPCLNDATDPLITTSSFLQSESWAQFKSDFGWQYDVFLFQENDQQPWQKVIILYKTIKSLRLAYLPFATNYLELQHSETQARLDQFAAVITSVLRKNTFLLRFDTPYQNQFTLPENTRAKRLYLATNTWRSLANFNIQPQDTVLLDLEQSNEELLAQMHKKCRYNIKLSLKKGVTIEQVAATDVKQSLQTWYKLYQDTAIRDGIALHSLNYYQSLFEHAATSTEIELKLYLAQYDSQTLAGIIVINHGNTSTYLFGASGNEHRETMPTYALQWQAITDAKAAGYLHYDFYGIPPSKDDTAHPMHGLYRFKTGFGGTIVHTAGLLDLPLSPLIYTLYRSVEKARYFYYKTVKKWFKKH